jgi:hypothetical protein
VEVEDRLATPLADVDDDPVVLEPKLARGVGDELEHSLRLVGRKLADLAKRRDVPLRDDEEMRFGAGVDIADRDEAVARVDVVALAAETAEETVIRQRERPPR